MGAGGRRITCLLYTSAAYTNAIRDAVAVNETAEVDPRNYMKYVKTKCEEIAEGKMRLFHSAGMA